jgi:FKBP-type peptidyl-prolyl cis-trans isomerase SlyD
LRIDLEYREQGMGVGDGMWVTVRYRLFDSLGEAVEDAERELTYLHGGFGSVFPKIEAALAGHDAGYATSVYLQPEDGFGDYDAELVNLAPRSEFPEQLEVGMTFESLGEGEDERNGIFTVTDFNEESVVLDGNHPLAGMSLRFDLRITEVREASEEEIEQERRMALENDGGLDLGSLLDDADAGAPRDRSRLH